MEQTDLLEKQQARCLTRLEELADKYYTGEIPLLSTIPGIQKFGALCILSETGNDTDAFGKASHPVGWQVCVHETMNRRAGYSRAKHCTATNTCGRCLSKYPG
jgi:hypothetical protein